jgi:hypothetical protein
MQCSNNYRGNWGGWGRSYCASLKSWLTYTERPVRLVWRYHPGGKLSSDSGSSWVSGSGGGTGNRLGDVGRDCPWMLGSAAVSADCDSTVGSGSTPVSESSLSSDNHPLSPLWCGARVDDLLKHCERKQPSTYPTTMVGRLTFFSQY